MFRRIPAVWPVVAALWMGAVVQPASAEPPPTAQESIPCPDYCRWRRDAVDCLLMGVHPAAALLRTRLLIEFDGPEALPSVVIDGKQIPLRAFFRGANPARFFSDRKAADDDPRFERLPVKPTEIERAPVIPVEPELIPFLPPELPVDFRGQVAEQDEQPEPQQLVRARKVLRKAEASLLAGDHDLARSHYERVCRLCPGSDCARLASERLQQLRAREIIERVGQLRLVGPTLVGPAQTEEEASAPPAVDAGFIKALEQMLGREMYRVISPRLILDSEGEADRSGGELMNQLGRLIGKLTEGGCIDFDVTAGRARGQVQLGGLVFRLVCNGGRCEIEVQVKEPAK